MEFEYAVRKTTSVHPTGQLGIINGMVEKGWELMSVAGTINAIYLYFRRPK
jgi:hypothetical protein